ncbi:MAG: hypothetical protein A2901_05780 [Elusimicrobia bacterium RIFCSPLOWO2_01_FULL_54_10]|nr:MAG: hypothetical protein A2901_05780 [Elusimicrobia bacterium RIFCSPLOWO2_01_FULL_54_10]
MRGLKSFFAGLILLPFMLATLYRLPGALINLENQASSLALIVSGALAYVLIEALFERPMRTYVFGHELTHALAALAMGGKVHSFKVSEKGGRVTLSKSNFFVALAPYCVPIYTVFTLLVYWIFRKFHPFPQLGTLFLVLTGSTLAFHASLTLFAIRQEQPDLKKTGTFFSIVFILLFNAWFLAALTKILFWHSFGAKAFMEGVLRSQADIWLWIWAQGRNLLKFTLARSQQP